MAITDHPEWCKNCGNYIPPKPDESQGSCKPRGHRVRHDWTCPMFIEKRDEPKPAKKKRATKKRATKKTDSDA